MPQESLRWHLKPGGELARDAALQAHWDRLNRARLDLPILSAEAVAAALAAFGAGTEQIVIAEGPAGPRAMAVVVRSGRGRWSTFQPSQLPLGCWVADPDLPLDALARRMLRAGLPGFALAMSFTQIDPLQAERTPDTPDIRHDDYIPTSWLEVAGSFEDYWAARGKNLRQNMRKQRNKLAADGIEARMRLLREPAEMAPALARYGELESSGWKAGQGTAIHPDNAQGRFYRQLLEGAARQGQALVSEYLFGERTVAMNLGLLRNGCWIVLKTTYDESVGKALSPASLLREDELQHFFAHEEVRRLEYYGRTMEWHTKLTEQQRVLYHHTTYRWAWLRQLAESRQRRAEAQALSKAPAEDAAQPAAGPAGAPPASPPASPHASPHASPAGSSPTGPAAGSATAPAGTVGEPS